MLSVNRLLTFPSVYQEFLAKTLTDKYSNLNQQLDQVLSDANSELNILNQRISSMSSDASYGPQLIS